MKDKINSTGRNQSAQVTFRLPGRFSFSSRIKTGLTYRAYGEKEAKMPEMEKILHQIKEVSSRTARIQGLAGKMNTLPEHTLDSYNAAVLSANLEIAIEHLLTVQKMVSYLSRPVQETSRLCPDGYNRWGLLFFRKSSNPAGAAAAR